MYRPPVPPTVSLAWRRMRGRGIGHWLRRERTTILHIAKTTFAAALAWELAGRVLGSTIPALAALAALLTVQVTVYRTLAQGLQQVIGVIAGVAGAVVLTQLLGVSAWTIAILIFGALALGRLLRLGMQSNQVAISALLVVSLGTGYGATRVWDTIFGAAVGMVISAVFVSPAPVITAREALADLGDDLGDLLTDVGTGLADGRVREHASGWLDRARLIDDQVHAARDRLNHGAESLRYNLLRARRDPDVLPALTEGYRALAHLAVQARSISRTIADAVGPDAIAVDGLAGVPTYGRMLTAAGQAVTAFAHLIGRGVDLAAFGTPAEHDQRLRQALADAHAAARDAQRATADRFKPGGAQWRLTGSLLAIADRLLREVDPDDGPHVDALH